MSNQNLPPHDESILVRVITLNGYNEERENERKFVEALTGKSSPDFFPKITHEFVEKSTDYFTVGINEKIIDNAAMLRAICLVSEHLSYDDSTNRKN